MTETATGAMIDRLQRFARSNWHAEPEEVARLRDRALPPMGTMPPVLYANFNTFWMGENIQVVRQLALDGALPPEALNRMAAALLRRHAARLAKWELDDTVALALDLAAYFEAGGARSHDEAAQVCEAAMVAFDRINAWIDAMIPWAHLDGKVALLKAAG